MIFVLMGVSGSGKTTIGKLLAEQTGTTFADADDYHPLETKQKMAAGHPLDDEDREPWLETLNQLMLTWFKAGKGGVLACSALKAKYRNTLSAGIAPEALKFIWLDLSKQILTERLSERHHEFMNPDLLDSQLKTLEPPADALRILNDREPKEVVREILAKILPEQNLNENQIKK
jgi:gluconokinase